ncbi:hypothetical protein RRF57_004978 [Xylaria bambusicola]|uniref:NACHT-NTPase and P-loop NTPases N-terminal domain-containing protein n=1 Tax=Xylaria bambusicola TaxID=326684 RepID=A0AAN7UH76_9PEZI
MEGFAALGVVVNVAQVLEYGFKLLQKSGNLRDVGVLDPDLDNDARRVRTLAASLSTQALPTSHEGLQNLALQCVEVSAELIEELDALRVTDPKSKRQRVMAIWKSERRKKHIDTLEKRLNSYKTQLNLHLSSLSR